jgi:flagellar biosynthesis/type III secretory pathway M-ring protein FliF/YscJ
VEFVIVLVVLGVVVFVVTAPLRRERASRENDAAAGERLAELEAERDAKYREIRDAELDHETGKLSDSDYDAVDRTLRAEAVEIMHAIDQETGQSSADSTDVRADPE